MVESFEEFLKKNFIRSENGEWFGNKKRLYCIDKKQYPLPASYISVIDLGEWAWSFWLEIEHSWKQNWPRDYYRSKPVSVKDLKECNYICEIAIACLGEKEIKKRLQKEIKK